MTHPHPKGNFVPKAVLMKSGIKSLNTAGQNFSKAAVLGDVTTAGPKAVVSNIKGNEANAVKASTCWVWRPKQKVLDHVFRHNGNPQPELQEKRVIDSGCSRHMIRNKSYLSDYEEIDGGFVAFGGDPNRGRITGKGKISLGKLDFKDVYFVKELKFNLFSVSQMCDRKNNVLFIDTECVVLSPDFKLLDENHVLLRVPRKDNMYSVDLKNIVPSGGLTYLFSKATLDESNLWHRRLGHVMNRLCEKKGIKREFSIARTRQQNGVAERKTRTLIEAARTMLADSKLSTTFWAEAVNTTCYVVFDGKADEGFFVGYSTNSKAYRVFNSRTRIVEENLHVKFRNQTNGNAGTKENIDAGQDGKKIVPDQKYILLPLLTSDPSLSKSSKDSLNVGFKPLGEEEKIDSKHKENEDSEVPNTEDPRVNQEQDANVNNTNNINIVSPIVSVADIENKFVDENIVYGCIHDLNMPNLEEIVYSDDNEEVGVEADMNNLATNVPISPIPTIRVHKDHLLEQIIRDIHSAPQTKRMTKNVTEHVKPKKNKKDARGIVVRNKARLVVQGYTQEEGIDYDKVFAHVARIEAIRLFLAYASFMGFIMYQIDVKSAFLYEKALYGLHQAPRAWYETLSTYLLENGFRRKGLIDKTLFIKKDKGDILLVQSNVDDIIFGSTKKSLCVEFEQMMHKRFQMSSIRERTFFLGLQVKQKDDGIFISQDNEEDTLILKVRPKLGLGILVDSPFDIGSVLLIHTIVANSTTEANETVYKEWEDRMERAATTASSLVAEQDNRNINRTQSMTTLNESFPVWNSIRLNLLLLVLVYAARHTLPAVRHKLMLQS
ncbi:putative ribonuclease H-like domain-containing protein [Tanacetum coccineum]